MPTIMHFQVPTDNVERAKSFYSKLFGWEIKEIPGMDYWMITTSGEKKDFSLVSGKGNRGSSL